MTGRSEVSNASVFPWHSQIGLEHIAYIQSFDQSLGVTFKGARQIFRRSRDQDGERKDNDGRLKNE